MFAALLALTGCIWIGKDAHEQRVEISEIATLTGPEFLAACNERVFVVQTPVSIPLGAQVTWWIEDGVETIVELDVHADGTGSFEVPLEAFPQTCDPGLCPGGLSATLTLDGSTFDGFQPITMVVEPGVAVFVGGDELTMDSLTEVNVLADPSLRVEVRVGEGQETDLLLCPLSSAQCIRVEVDADGNAPTAPLDLCPGPIAEHSDWVLFAEVTPTFCSSPLPLKEVGPALFVRDDCDGDEILRPEDCNDFDPNAPALAGIDADGDSYGDQATAQSVCVLPPTWVWGAEDCDDASGDVNPGILEDSNCDHIDDDCDGFVDEDGPIGPIFDPDDDQDGFGVFPGANGACSGYVYGGDCDDSESLRNPGLAEDPLDNLDNNCDGITGCESLDCADRLHWISGGRIGLDREVGIGVIELPNQGAVDLVHTLTSPPTQLLLMHADQDSLPDIAIGTADGLFIAAGSGSGLTLLDSGPVKGAVAGYFDDLEASSTLARQDLVIFGQNETIVKWGGNTIPLVLPGLTGLRAAHTVDFDPDCGEEILVVADAGVGFFEPTGGFIPQNPGSFDDALVEDVDQDGLLDIVAWGDSGLWVGFGDGEELIGVGEAQVAAASSSGGVVYALRDSNILSRYLPPDFEPESVVLSADGFFPDPYIRSLAFGQFDDDGLEDLAVGTFDPVRGDQVLLDWRAPAPGASFIYQRPNSSVFAHAVDLDGGGIDSILIENDMPTGFGAGLDYRSELYSWNGSGFDRSEWFVEATTRGLFVGPGVVDRNVQLSLPACLNRVTNPPPPP